MIRDFRCEHCGAPLTPPPDGSAFVRCDYCGSHYQLDKAAPAPKPDPKPAAKPAARPAAPADEAGPADATYAVGDTVSIRYGSTWYDGTIVGVRKPGLWRAHYEGWSSSSDEDVRAGRLRPRVVAPKTEPVAVTAATAGSLTVGQAIEVESSSVWYPATVIALRKKGARIRYDGYDASYDEHVGWDRIRIP